MPRFERVIGQQPRFALAKPHFRFRALAACAGRASIGGDREVAMACLVGGRLASSLLAPFAISHADSTARSVAAKQWLSSLSLPAPVRMALGLLAEAVSSGDASMSADALSRLIATSVHSLDESSIAELRALIVELGLAR